MSFTIDRIPLYHYYIDGKNKHIALGNPFQNGNVLRPGCYVAQTQLGYKKITSIFEKMCKFYSSFKYG
jgi:hypothetical protein